MTTMFMSQAIADIYIGGGALVLILIIVAIILIFR